MWFQDTVDVDVASIIWQRWEVQSFESKFVELVQESHELVWQF